jgi:hypothetical protein
MKFSNQVLSFVLSIFFVCVMPQSANAFIWIRYTPPPSTAYFIYYSGGTVNAGSLGTTDNLADESAIYYAKISISAAGTVTKLGIYLEIVNAASSAKIALLNSSFTQIGATTSWSITSGDGQWHDQTVGLTIPAAGDYYIAFSMDGPFSGSLVARQQTSQPANSGGVNIVDSYSSGFPGAAVNFSGNTSPVALRLEFTP